MFNDLKLAMRALRKSPGFIAIAILTLALGIGATTAIFSVVQATLLRPLPYPQPERLVAVWHVHHEGSRMAMFSNPNFQDIRQESQSFAALAEYGAWTTTASDGRDATRLTAAMVSKEFFAVMDTKPMLGRAFAAEEMRPNGAPVVLVSHGYWKSTLGGKADIAGSHVSFDRKSYSVIGVMPAGFRFPGEAELWIPLEQLEIVAEGQRSAHNWQVVGRLKPGVRLQQAQADVSRVARAMKTRYGKDTTMSDAAVLPLKDMLVGNAKSVLMFLLGAACVLLLASCANTANLLLARYASRQQEFAVRAALGAGRGRLLMQFFAEACVLTLGGGALGVLFAYWSVNSLLALGSGHLQGVTGISIDTPILAFSVAISFATAAGLSLFLGVRIAQRDLFAHLKSGERRQTGSVRDRGVRTTLMTAQIAIATLLLAGAGLLARSLLHVMDIQPGFKTENVLTADIFLSMTDALDYFQDKPGAKAERLRRAQLLGQIERRVQAIPGVTSTGIVRDRPLMQGMMSNGTFLLADTGGDNAGLQNWPNIVKLMQDPQRAGYAWYQSANGGYFRTLQIPLKRGRLFDDRDTPQSQHAAIISENLAHKRWPGQDPVGRRIQFGSMDGDLRLLEIVGVVGDVHHRGLEQEAEPAVYVNSAQRPPTAFSLVIHTNSAPAAMIPAIRTALRAVDTQLVPQFQTYPQVVSASFGERQFQLGLLGMFAAGALLLAVLGLYGVTAYMVAERTREIGVRMALGAQATDVIGLVLRQGFFAVGIGIVIGLCAEIALTGVLKGMVYGVSAVDPATLASVGIALAALALLACWVPARRATKVDPLVALRAE